MTTTFISTSETAVIVFDDSAVGALEFTVSWEKDGTFHEEWFLGRKFNAVNDIFPRGMREALEGKEAGEAVSLTYEPRHCIPRFKESLVTVHSLRHLRPQTLKCRAIRPQVGRFYPEGYIFFKPGNNSDNLAPFRLIEMDDTNFTADCNHPLAEISVSIEAKIQYLEKRNVGTYGSLTHWREKTCDWGPGMQARYKSRPTEFFHPHFFERIKPDDTPFSPPPVDAAAQANFAKTYARFLKPGMKVLDLSSASIPTFDVDFDAACLTLSIEYMPTPLETLKVIHNRLKPGGIVLVGFTNHYDACHVIQGWVDLHEFERMGLVLEYLRLSGFDAATGTISLRNDWRHTDDAKFLETRGVSDPIFVVWGRRN